MIDWDDLRLFLAVARAGGLAQAAAAAAASPPTLGRRMLVLEQALGVELFERRRNGYDLTRAGQQLLERAETLEQGALSVERWRAAIDPPPSVRIAAGAWTSAFIARHAGRLREGEAELSLELLTGAGMADLARREANLGIRNRRPDHGGLAGRRLGRVEFAVYGARAALAEQPEAGDERRFERCDWVTFAPDGPSVPSAAWLERQLRHPASLRCSAPQAVLDAALAGIGLCVLPCFVGDREAGLGRASGPIPELGHDQWLVSHDDDRHSPPIRRVADRLFRLFATNWKLFAGVADGRAEG